jgi:hypothetical protein
MLQNDRIIFNSSDYDKEIANNRAWSYLAAICSKKILNVLQRTHNEWLMAEL